MSQQGQVDPRVSNAAAVITIALDNMLADLPEDAPLDEVMRDLLLEVSSQNPKWTIIAELLAAHQALSDLGVDMRTFFEATPAAP
jgi:hypothetical protein